MIGERLQELRKDAELTQDELATILSINKHSISSYERDKSEPPDDIKIALAQLFHVSVDYLLGLTDNLTPVDEYAPALRLPDEFPRELIPELKNYAAYLMYKKRHQKEPLMERL